MSEKSFFKRSFKGVAIAICLANSVLAQETVSYHDSSGVTAKRTDE